MFPEPGGDQHALTGTISQEKNTNSAEERVLVLALLKVLKEDQFKILYIQLPCLWLYIMNFRNF